MSKIPLSAHRASAFPVVFELPSKVYEGIGKIVSAHAVLETLVSELVYELMEIEYPQGRVVLRYQAASERFKTARRLLTLHGITPGVDTTDLFKQIENCCNYRDQFSHGIWVQAPDGLALRLTRGEYETDEGTADRSFVPQATFIPDTSYEENRNTILSTVQAVARLKDEVKAELQRRSAKS
jgi:hypothetical protein